MAVPKKRTGHSAQGSRRSNWKATKPETTKCPNCGATVLAHTVCTACGTYKGQPVSLKDKAAEKKVSTKKAEAVEKVVEETVETVAEEKPATKSTTKKTTTKKTTAKKTEE